MIHGTKKEDRSTKTNLTDRKFEFLKLATQTAMTYQEIADKMFLSIKTIENYQRGLFKKFGVKNRPALMLFEQEHNIIGYRSEEHTSELQSRGHLVCRLLLEKKKI